MTSRQMILGMQFSGGYGAASGAWRLPGANLNSYTDMDQFVRYAQAAERGKIQLLFIADTPVLDVDLDNHSPHHMINPLLILTVLARETERIGLVTTASTTFTEPYNLARQFKALDVISHGRAGWNAVTTSDPAAAANFGATIPPRTEKYERAHEVTRPCPLVQVCYCPDHRRVFPCPRPLPAAVRPRTRGSPARCSFATTAPAGAAKETRR
ncbi:hypothetical protein SPURM210S_04368 [Streptomyces purpurascens]